MNLAHYSLFVFYSITNVNTLQELEGCCRGSQLDYGAFRLPTYHAFALWPDDNDDKVPVLAIRSLKGVTKINFAFETKQHTWKVYHETLQQQQKYNKFMSRHALMGV